MCPLLNTAAASYCWDNVASYDYTFRHLMEFNPKRSWASTYNQMWNLSMKDPIPKSSSHSRFGAQNSTTQQQFYKTNNINNGNGTQNKRKKQVCCWNFNKGVPCKYGKKCRFIERCSYCDSSEHAVLSCPKLVDKPGGDKH